MSFENIYILKDYVTITAKVRMSFKRNLYFEGLRHNNSKLKNVPFKKIYILKNYVTITANFRMFL